METKNFDELIKQKLAEIEALKQEKEEMEKAKKANIENLQKEKGDLLIQIKRAKEKLDTLEIAKKDIQVGDFAVLLFAWVSNL